jgi:cytochrome b
MRANYFTNLAYLLAAGFLVVVSRAFTPSVAGWIAFGVSTGIVVIGLASVMLTSKRVPQLGHAAIVVMALWSLIAALVFTGGVLGWLVFADALAVGAVALVNLGIHEFSTERVVHELQIVAPQSSTSQMQHEAA